MAQDEMTMVKLFEAVSFGLLESFALMVKVTLSVALGVPEMTPVVAFSLRPAGSGLPACDHL